MGGNENSRTEINTEMKQKEKNTTQNTTLKQTNDKTKQWSSRRLQLHRGLRECEETDPRSPAPGPPLQGSSVGSQWGGGGGGGGVVGGGGWGGGGGGGGGGAPLWQSSD